MSNDTPESKLVVTSDGSHTVYSEQFSQHYHNPNGAIAESRYVFFEQTGLLDDLRRGKEVTILEVGFGTGLNLMLLLDYVLQADTESDINYYSVEGFPIDYEVAQNFNYADHLDHPEIISDVTAVFKELARGMNTFLLLDNIRVHLFHGLFEDLQLPELAANYIFHDAFSPNVNPDLWTGEVFKRLHGLSAGDVILSTYCAASKARGAMAWAGWNMARARGALGKREMTVAALDPQQLGDRKRVNEERLARRYEEEDF